MKSQYVNIFSNNDLLTIELNRISAGNALNLEMCNAIIHSLGNLEENIKVIKICSVGVDFCSGRESPMLGLGLHPSGEKIRKIVAKPPLQLYDAIRNASVPVISVVRGKASGAGCALACVCDVTYASETAIFDVNEMDRDIPPTLVMTALLGKVPIKTLSHLILSREKLSGFEALHSGLISKVTSEGELEDTSNAFINKLLTNSIHSLSAIKQFLIHAPEMSSHSFSTFAGHLAGTALSTKF
ncbi:MAG: enoyl-CoA hydratase/isomerase family protein [Betaproteobacteria bacterium]|jgi:enoyl-CoA hydratase